MVISDGVTDDLSKLFIEKNKWSAMTGGSLEDRDYSGEDRFDTKNPPTYTCPPVILIFY